MYICLDCHTLFQEPWHLTETHGFTSPPYEEYNCCPNCFGDYSKAYKCEECGEYIVDDYVKTKSDNRICTDCYDSCELGDERDI